MSGYDFFAINPGLYPWPKLLVKNGFKLVYKPRDAKFKSCLDKLELKPKQKVLEIGCGQGVFLARLVQTYPVQAWGVDISRSSIDSAQQWSSSRLSFQVADACQLPFKDELFDCVLSFDCLEHIANQDRALAEAMRVLKPGGKLLLYTINKYQKFTWNYWLNKIGIKTLARVDHDPQLFLDPGAAQKELHQLGLRGINVELFNAFFTLAADEAIMVVIKFAKGAGGFQKRRAGQLFLQVINFFSRLLLEPLDWLDNPWKKAGFSNSFFILGKKK